MFQNLQRSQIRYPPPILGSNNDDSPIRNVSVNAPILTSVKNLIDNELVKINNRFSTLSTLRSFRAQILAPSAAYDKVAYNGVSSEIDVSLAMPISWGSEFDSVSVGGVNVIFNIYNDTNAASYFLRRTHPKPRLSRFRQGLRGGPSPASASHFRSSEFSAHFACVCGRKYRHSDRDIPDRGIIAARPPGRRRVPDLRPLEIQEHSVARPCSRCRSLV